MTLAESQAVHLAARAAKREFFLLGLGRRRKLVWRDGAIFDAFTWERLKHWPDAKDAWVHPENHEVWFELPRREEVKLSGVPGVRPDETDVWEYWPMEVEDTERGTWVGNRGSVYSRRAHYSISRNGEYLSEHPIHLPLHGGIPTYGDPRKFHEYDVLLRALLGEILFNIRPADGAPLPNLFVYPRPSYRVAAAVAMVLQRTNNLHLIFDWVWSLRDPFDHASGGDEEPDNLGQVLYLVSLVSDKSHPLVGKVLEQIPRFRVGHRITGRTDFAEHSVYQTKWLKFGLRSLGLDDPFVIPEMADSYSSLFWWDFKDQHVPGPRFDAATRERRPYFAWAEAHFHGDPPPLPDGLLRAVEGTFGVRNHFTGPYPLTWESDAGHADYAGMARLSAADAAARTCRPHAWHAAEMFLYLFERGRVITASDPLLDEVWGRNR